ncbi:hypothetical protein NESM_000359600 [Novymonas esmeraldas]|uniref:Uncharacterized protein n=1 Tax=Novymonas esmeraldas TaxID=1808958 RepID=A0AAW0ELB4_9TRYP
MEFSSTSSSDAELEEELHRNFHRERREQLGIIRASSANTRGLAVRFTLPDGRSIDVRKGAIYIPSRDLYVHVLQARRCPERWFGDGRVPLRRRQPLSADAVVLQRVGDGLVAAARAPVDVALSQATDNGFFVFKEVVRRQTGERATVASSSAEAEAVSSAPVTRSPRPWCDPFTDVRFQRVVSLSRWRFSADHPQRLRELRHDTWDTAALDLALHSEDACCNDGVLGIVWRLSGRDGGVWYLRNGDTASANGTAPTSIRVALIPQAASQRCVEMYCTHTVAPSPDTAVSDSLNRGTCVCRLLVVTTTHVLHIHLLYSRPDESAVVHALSTLRLGSALATPLLLASVTCCCLGDVELPPPPPSAPALPNSAAVSSNGDGEFSFCVGAGRSVFAFLWRGGQWRKTRVVSFAATDVTAVAVVERVGLRVPVVVAGMRNGTMQVVEAVGRRRGKVTFDPTPRHTGSDIIAVYPALGLVHGVVSVARDGGAKVWDLRRLPLEKDPVHTLLEARPGGGQAGVCSSAMVGPILAASSISTGLVCVDVRTAAQLFHTADHLSPSTRLTFGPSCDGDGGYELFTFGPYYTQHLQLCP